MLFLQQSLGVGTSGQQASRGMAVKCDVKVFPTCHGRYLQLVGLGSNIELHFPESLGGSNVQIIDIWLA